MPVEKNFELAADAERLASFRMQLGEDLRQAGLDERITGEILVAVQEALTNIIRHAYRGKPGKIDVRFCDYSDRVEISIRDFGSAFDPKKIPAPELPPGKPGGLGLHLIKTLMDRVDYAHQGQGGNLLSLVKYKKQPGEKKGRHEN